MKIPGILKKRYAVILLILIFLLALYIRAIPGTKLTYPRLQAIDPYLIYRISEFLATHGYIPLDNYVGYGTVKNGFDQSSAFLLFYTYASFYWLLHPIFGINYYWVGVWVPAILAAFQVVVLYFLVKELFGDKKIALLSAFFYAVIPGILYRSAAGFIEKEPVGMIFILAGLTFFIKSIKVYEKNENHGFIEKIFRTTHEKQIFIKNFIYALMAGIIFYFGRITWGGVSFALLLIAIYTFAALLLLENKRQTLISLITIWVTIKVLEAAIGIGMLGGNNGMIYLGVTGLYLFSVIGEEVINRYAAEYKKYSRFLPHLILIILIPIIFIASYISLDIGNIVNSVIEYATTIETKAVILSTVAESQTATDVLRTAPTQFGNGYAISVFKLPSFLSLFSTYYFALLGLLIAAISIILTFYRKINRTNLAYIFIIVLFLVALRSSVTFIRMGIMLALAISIAGSFGFVKFLDYGNRYAGKYLKKGKIKYWYAAIIIIALLTFSTNFASGYVFANGIYTSLDNSWYEALTWIRDNTDKSDVVLEWWDFGYWFHYIAKRRTLVDGGYHGQLPTQDIAKFYTQPITDWSLKFLKNYSVDYVMVSPDLIGKFGAMSKIANWGKKVDVLPVFRLSNRYQKGDKMLFEYSMGNQKIIFAFSMIAKDNTTAMGNMTAIYRYGLSQEPIRYIGLGKEVIDTGASNGIDAMVYITQGAAIFIPPDVKDCAFVRLYLLDGAGLEQYFEKVYDKLGMKIYKVRYDNFPEEIKNWKIENPNIDEEHNEFIPYGIGGE